MSYVYFKNRNDCLQYVESELIATLEDDATDTEENDNDPERAHELRLKIQDIETAFLQLARLEELAKLVCNPKIKRIAKARASDRLLYDALETLINKAEELIRS